MFRNFFGNANTGARGAPPPPPQDSNTDTNNNDESNNNTNSNTQTNDNNNNNNAKASNEENIPKNDTVNYRQIRAAVESEKELMKLMVSLGEDKFNKLMGTSSEFGKTLERMRVLENEAAYSQERRAKYESDKAKQEEDTKKLEIEREHERKLFEQKKNQAKELEYVKTAEKKKKIDYFMEQKRKEEEKLADLRLREKQVANQLDEERLKKEEEYKLKQIQRKKELEDWKIRQKFAMKREDEREMAEFRFREAQKVYESRKSDELEKSKALKRIEVEGLIATEQTKWDNINNFLIGEKGHERLRNIGLLLGGSLALLYFLKTVQPIATRGLSNYFFRPALLSHYQKYSFIKNTLPFLSRSKAKLPPIVLEPQLEEKLKRVVESTKNTHKRGGFFGSLLLYGKPGTGKTLFIQKMAQDSRMDFAYMSGPAFDQFPAGEAIQEIKNLFKWANRSRHGVLLFVSEADSFLEDRNTLNRERVRVLNEWLNQTGTESKKIMCVYDTNRPEVIDSAVQSRLTKAIEFKTPRKIEIKEMLGNYFGIYLDEKKNLFLENEKEREEYWERLAERLEKEDFVGRDVTNLVIAISHALYSDKDFMLTKELVESVVVEQIEKKRNEEKFRVKREQQREFITAITKN